MNAKHQTQPWIRDASQRRQPEIQSSLVREIFQRIVGQTNNDCRFQILTLTNLPRQQHSLVGRQDSRLRYVRVSQFPTEALLWIKEVELVDSVDDLKSSLSFEGTHGQDFELLDARIASALNRIIHDSHFKGRVSLEEKSPT